MPKCWKCSKAEGIKTFWEREGIRSYCASCFEEVKAERQKDIRDYLALKKKLMFERAVKILERQQLDIYEYKEAIETVQEFLTNNPDKFDSADEIAAAIILLDNEIPMKIQHKVDEYHVDFCLPTLKIVLEIDGYLHASSLAKDNERDIKVRKALGASWEVVRIKTEYIEQNAEMLVEAIKAVKAEKQKLRKQYNGFLPDWYSKREFKKSPRRQNYGDDDLIDI